ncbi:hypothetical protein YC2023_094099 [Brassica napus]
MDNVGWEFVLDPSKKGNALFIEDDTNYEDFLRMVCEDYKISEMEAVEFAYMLPTCILEQMPSNTPPIFFSNNIQLASFITLFKTNIINVQYETMKPSQEIMNQQPHDSMNQQPHEPMKPSLETMKPSQLRKSETINSGDIFSGKKELIMKLRKLSVIKRFDFIIKSLGSIYFMQSASFLDVPGRYVLQLCRNHIQNSSFVNILIFIHALRPISILATDMQMQNNATGTARQASVDRRRPQSIDSRQSQSLDSHNHASIDNRLAASIDTNPPRPHTIKSQPDFYTNRSVGKRDLQSSGNYRGEA